MSRLELNNNHPLIPNSNQYLFERKFVSINSEDRDLIKYPNSSEFEIELPQDYVNVQSVKLYSWSFPANYNVFSIDLQNVYMSFKISEAYNPGANGCDPTTYALAYAIYRGLYANKDNNYAIFIENGFYNPLQMANELTTKMNESVTKFLQTYLTKFEPTVVDSFKGYYRFSIVYNSVGQKIWFGNNADRFILTNSSAYQVKQNASYACVNKALLPNYSDIGLPGFIGLTRNDTTAFSVAEYGKIGGEFAQNYVGYYPYPRFYYGDILTAGDQGFWCLPNPLLPGAIVYFIQPTYKINFMGPDYIYMEIAGLNCIDETTPFSLSETPKTQTTATPTIIQNQTNGIVNSFFAKIPISSTPLSQWFDTNMEPYKHFNPPAERIRKLKIKFRYHNNSLINFGIFPFSFMLEFNLIKNQQERRYSVKDSYNLGQLQSFS
jgi:hypothetical protein